MEAKDRVNPYDGAVPALGPTRTRHEHGDSSAKSAEHLAAKIEQEILKSGLPVGAVYGSETDLIKQSGVSRAVFREAVRLIESHHVARMRRGRGGGLIVTEPTPDATSRAISVYLQFWNVRAEELREARVAIELQCVEMAIARLDGEAREQLEGYLAAEARQVNEAHGPVFHFAHGFHALIAGITRNEPLELFVRCLIDLTEHEPQREQDLEARARIHRAHAGIAKAILDGDHEAARRRMQRHLHAVEDWWLPDIGT